MTLIKVSINCQKRTDGFWQLIETFLKPKIPLFEISINLNHVKITQNDINKSFDPLPKKN